MARRGANGEGTVYPRKDGRWEAALYAPTASGRRRRIRLYAATRADAKAALAKEISRIDQGLLNPDRPWTVGRYLGYWLANVVKPNSAGTTHLRYEGIIRLHLLPYVGKLPLRQLSAQRLQLVFNSAKSDGVSTRNLHQMRAVLSSALSRAMREDLTTRNVAQIIELPSYTPKDVAPWSIDEATRFLSSIHDDASLPVFALLLLYGLRRGEVVGLRWSDVSFADRLIRIRQQLQRLNGQIQALPVKTRAGVRDLPLIPAARALLHAHRERQSTLGHRCQGDDLVFTNESGGPLGGDALLQTFKRLCRNHDARPISIHRLRHTTATLLKRMSVPARDAQLILGHADVTTTQQIYQHADVDLQRTGLTALADRLLTAVVDGSRRQGSLPSEVAVKQPEKNHFLVINSGTPEGIQTPVLRYRNSISPFGPLSPTEAMAGAKHRARALLVGAVAVNYCRQVHDTAGASDEP